MQSPFHGRAALAIGLLGSILTGAPGVGHARPETGTPSGRPSHANATVAAAPRPGDRVRLDGVGVVVPAPGHAVWAAALHASGGTTILGVETAADGSVTVHRDGAAPAAPKAALGSSSPCQDGAFTLYDTPWTTTYEWSFNKQSTPSEVDQDKASTALRDAVGNITHADNDCDLADRVSAKHAYQGTTSQGANIAKDSTCTGSDGTSVIGFGDLLKTDLALTCWWTKNGHTIEADIRLNKTEYTWVVDIGEACTTKFSVEAVATHEAGHAFGLGHVSEAQHGSLTMSTSITACQESETTLGLGDVDGLEAMY